MDIKRRSTEFGAAIILFAVLLRLTTALATPAQAARGEAPLQLRRPAAAISAMPAATEGRPLPPAGEEPLPPQTTQQPAQQMAVLQLTAENSPGLRLRTGSDCGYQVALAPLLEQPLVWQLSGEAPTVLIVHSHACESYGGDQQQMDGTGTDCRSADVTQNMVAVGDALASELEAAGICVLHDRLLHDGTSYADAYTNSRNSVQAYLEQYPSIVLVLDLHRDAAIDYDGTHYAARTWVGGESVAQMMIVVGSDYGGGVHPAWQENLALALKLQVVLEQLCPGITRAATLRGSRFNQDLSPGALLIEVGASGNTLEEALRAVPYLAQAILALQNGANCA